MSHGGLATSRRLPFHFHAHGGVGRLALAELTVGPIGIDRLELEVTELGTDPGAAAAERFQRRRTRLRGLAVRITQPALDDRIAQIAKQLSGTGLTQLAARLDDGYVSVRARAADGLAAADLSFHIELVSAGTQLRALASTIRVHGHLPTPGPVIADRLVVALLGAGDAAAPDERPTPRGLCDIEIDLVGALLWQVLPPNGWRLPAVSEIELTHIRVARGAIEVAYGPAGSRTGELGVRQPSHQLAAAHDLMHSVDAQLHGGHFEDAMRGFRALLASSGPDQPLLLERILALAAARPAWFFDGLELARQALGRWPGFAPAHAALASITLAQGDARQAAKHLEQVARLASAEADDDQAALAALAAARLLRVLDARAATQLYQLAIEHDPASTEAADSLADRLADEQRWPELVRLVRARAGFTSDVARTVQLHLRLADVFVHQLSDPAGARHELAAARALAPDDPAIHEMTAQLLVTSDPPAAVAAWREVARLAELRGDHRTCSRAWARLGDLYAQPSWRDAGGPPGSAEEAWRHALELDPLQVEALVGLAGAAAERNDHAIAAALYERLRGQGLAHSVAARHELMLARSLVALGRTDDARASLRRATQAGGETAAEAHAMLAELAELTLDREHAAAELETAITQLFELATIHPEADRLSARAAELAAARAALLDRAGQPAAAAADWQRAHALARDAAPAIARAASRTLLARVGDDPGAEHRWIGAVLATDPPPPERAELLVRRAEALRKDRVPDLGAAIADVRAAIDLTDDPAVAVGDTRRRALRLAAELYAQRGDLRSRAEALAALTGLAGDATDRIDREAAAAAAWLEADDPTAALLHAARAHAQLTQLAADAAIAPGLRRDVLITLGEAAWHQRAWPDVIDAYTGLLDATAEPPQIATFRHRLAVAADRTGDHATALAALRPLIDDPDAARGSPPELRAQVLRLFAELADRAGELVRAAMALEAFAAIGDGSPTARADAVHRAGELFRRAERPDDSIRCLETALRISDAHLPALDALEAAWRERGDLERVAVILGRKVAATARHPARQKPLLSRLGDLQDQLGRPDVALATHQRALEIDPMWRPSLRYVSLGLRDSGQVVAAAGGLAQLAGELHGDHGVDLAIVTRERQLAAEALSKLVAVLDDAQLDAVRAVARPALDRAALDNAPVAAGIARLRGEPPPGPATERSEENTQSGRPTTAAASAQALHEAAGRERAAGKLDAAFATLETANHLRPGDPGVLRELVEIATQLGDTAAAARHLTALAHRLSGARRGDALLELADLYYDQLDDAVRGREAMRRAADAFGSGSRRDATLRMLATEAATHLAWDIAVDAIISIAVEKRTQADFTNLATALMRAGRDADALGVIEAAMAAQRFDDHGELLRQLQHEIQRKTDLVRALEERALGAAPEEAAALLDEAQQLRIAIDQPGTQPLRDTAAPNDTPKADTAPWPARTKTKPGLPTRAVPPARPTRPPPLGETPDVPAAEAPDVPAAEVPDVPLATPDELAAEPPDVPLATPDELAAEPHELGEPSSGIPIAAIEIPAGAAIALQPAASPLADAPPAELLAKAPSVGEDRVDLRATIEPSGEDDGAARPAPAQPDDHAGSPAVADGNDYADSRSVARRFGDDQLDNRRLAERSPSEPAHPHGDLGAANATARVAPSSDPGAVATPVGSEPLGALGAGDLPSATPAAATSIASPAGVAATSPPVHAGGVEGYEPRGGRALAEPHGPISGAVEVERASGGDPVEPRARVDGVAESAALGHSGPTGASVGSSAAVEPAAGIGPVEANEAAGRDSSAEPRPRIDPSIEVDRAVDAESHAGVERPVEAHAVSPSGLVEANPLSPGDLIEPDPLSPGNLIEADSRRGGLDGPMEAHAVAPSSPIEPAGDVLDPGGAPGRGDGLDAGGPEVSDPRGGDLAAPSSTEAATALAAATTAEPPDRSDLRAAGDRDLLRDTIQPTGDELSRPIAAVDLPVNGSPPRIADPASAASVRDILRETIRPPDDAPGRPIATAERIRRERDMLRETIRPSDERGRSSAAEPARRAGERDVLRETIQPSGDDDRDLPRSFAPALREDGLDVLRETIQPSGDDDRDLGLARAGVTRPRIPTIPPLPGGDPRVTGPLAKPEGDRPAATSPRSASRTIPPAVERTWPGLPVRELRVPPPGSPAVNGATDDPHAAQPPASSPEPRQVTRRGPYTTAIPLADRPSANPPAGPRTTTRPSQPPPDPLPEDDLAVPTASEAGPGASQGPVEVTRPRERFSSPTLGRIKLIPGAVTRPGLGALRGVDRQPDEFDESERDDDDSSGSWQSVSNPALTSSRSPEPLPPAPLPEPSVTITGTAEETALALLLAAASADRDRLFAARRADPDDPSVLLALLAHLGDREPEVRNQLLEEAARTSHGRALAIALHELAAIAREARDPGRAVALWTRAYGADPGYPPVWMPLADALAAADDTETARELYEAVARSDDHDQGRRAFAAGRAEALGRDDSIVSGEIPAPRPSDLEEAKLLAESEDWPGAIDAAERASAARPDDPEVLEVLERIYFASGNVTKASDAIGRQLALADDPAQRAALWRRRARMYRDALGRDAEAYRCLKEAHECSPADPEIAYQLRTAAMVRGEWSLTAQLLYREIAAAANPRDRGALHLELALIYEERLEDLSQAQANYEQALAFDPTIPAVKLPLARRYEAIGRTLDAAKLYEEAAATARAADRTALLDAAARCRATAAEAAEPDLAAQLDRAEAAGDLDAALDLAYQLWRAEPGHPAAFRVLANLHRTSGDLSALTELTRVRASQAEAPEDRATAWLEVARLAEEVGALDQAARAYDLALIEDPGHVGALDARGALAFRLADFATADLVYRDLGTGESVLGDDELALRRSIIAEQLGRDSESLQLARLASQLAPGRRDVMMRVQELATRIGELPIAMAAARNVLELVPLDEDEAQLATHFALVELLREAGQLDEAVIHLEKILRDHPVHAAAIEALAQVHAARGDWQAATRYLYQLVPLAPSPIHRAERLYQLGEAVLVHLGDIDRADDVFLRASDLDPGHVPTLRRLLDVYWRSDDPGGIVEVATELAEKDALISAVTPDAALAHALIAAALVGDTQLAQLIQNTLGDAGPRLVAAGLGELAGRTGRLQLSSASTAIAELARRGLLDLAKLRAAAVGTPAANSL